MVDKSVGAVEVVVALPDVSLLLVEVALCGEWRWRKSNHCMVSIDGPVLHLYCD